MRHIVGMVNQKGWLDFHLSSLMILIKNMWKFVLLLNVLQINYIYTIMNV